MSTNGIKRKINIITFRMEHHADKSGHDCLADYIDNNLKTGSPYFTSYGISNKQKLDSATMHQQRIVLNSYLQERVV